MASTYRQVGFGSAGSAVSKLQTILNEHGYGLAVDGIFGEKTRAAVRDYQKRYNLKLDGIAGPETWGSLLGQNGSSSNGSYTGGGSSGKTSTSTNLPLGKVSDGTAAALDRLEKGYTPSSDVEAEQALLDSLAQLRPGDYESDFTAQLDALYQRSAAVPAFPMTPAPTRRTSPTPCNTPDRAGPPWPTRWARLPTSPAATAPATHSPPPSSPISGICSSCPTCYPSCNPPPTAATATRATRCWTAISCCRGRTRRPTAAGRIW